MFRGACESGVLVEVKKNCEGLGRELRWGAKQTAKTPLTRQWCEANSKDAVNKARVFRGGCESVV